MTTAHRPTWNPAQGGDAQSGNRWLAPRVGFSVKDMPGHLTLKQRQPAQGATAHTRKELLRDLEAKEADTHAKRSKVPRIDPGVAAEQLLDFSILEEIAAAPEAVHMHVHPDDVDDPVLLARAQQRAIGAGARGGGPGEGTSAAHQDTAGTASSAQGSFRESSAGEAEEHGEEDGEEEEDDEEEDEEDDTAELMRELERIKREKAEEAARLAAEEEEAAGNEREEAILHGNPLLQPGGRPTPGPGGFNVKRRWDDDVVFRNQAKKPEKAEPTFINDTLRTEFHKRFLRKYVK